MLDDTSAKILCGLALVVVVLAGIFEGLDVGDSGVYFLFGIIGAVAVTLYAKKKIDDQQAIKEHIERNR